MCLNLLDNTEAGQPSLQAHLKPEISVAECYFKTRMPMLKYTGRLGLTVAFVLDDDEQ